MLIPSLFAGLTVVMVTIVALQIRLTRNRVGSSFPVIMSIVATTTLISTTNALIAVWLDPMQVPQSIPADIVLVAQLVLLALSLLLLRRAWSAMRSQVRLLHEEVKDFFNYLRSREHPEPLEKPDQLDDQA